MFWFTHINIVPKQWFNNFYYYIQLYVPFITFLPKTPVCVCFLTKFNFLGRKNLLYSVACLNKTLKSERARLVDLDDDSSLLFDLKKYSKIYIQFYFHWRARETEFILCFFIRKLIYLTFACSSSYLPFCRLK